QWMGEVVDEGDECAQVLYRAPDEGPWAGVRILPARGRRVKVISACGIRWHEAVERRRAERHRLGLLDALNLHASGTAGTKRALVGALAPLPALLMGPPPRPLLGAAKTYRVVVSWQWQSWKPGGGGVTPPPPDPNAWRDGGTDAFAFSTAAAAPSTPVDLIGEGSFDPRGAARYVAGAEPTGESPHLLDDPIRVFFTVDYLPALLAAYGYEARIEVHPTDVAPGSLQLDPHAPNVVGAIELVSWLTGLRPTEELIAGAAGASECAPNTCLGGLAAEVKAKLEPETAYDLTLRARPRAGGDDSVISRFHFRTARYHGVAEILEALGLGVGVGEAAGEPPPDLLLERWSRPAAAPHDDFALQAALAAAGLEPWPLSPAPRTTTLWVPPSGEPTAWSLAAVLLEAPEPIARQGRIRVSGSVAGVALQHLNSTASGTRVLLAPDKPVAPGPMSLLRVRLEDALHRTAAEGSAWLPAVPETIQRELG
ncbi:MAG TPA: hypothetical protein VGV34_06025, partial [Solirubrobacterales bacterium]|nr:hypothetical protein [Solirubrobacterales bacterium]